MSARPDLPDPPEPPGPAPTADTTADTTATATADKSAAAADQDERLPAPRAALSAVTWKEIAHLLANLPMDLLGFVYVCVWIFCGALLSVTVVGLPVLALGLVGCRWFGSLERARARLLLDVRVDDPSPLRAAQPGFLGWLWAQLSDPVAWRHALYCFVRFPWGVLTFTVALVSLFAAWPLLPWVARLLTLGDRAMVRGLLSPSDGLELRIAELESDRVTVTDTASADLRRIERDLHDGAQARLVALAMDLGLAKEKLTEDPEAAARMVDEAHGEVKAALTELRDLARGIHPAILTDRGLDAALSSLAARCTIPVTVTVDTTTRPAPAIESITYFTASELLQNISKHANAHHATLDLWRTDNRLLLQVTDNGQGGATAHHGTGLAGLAERLDSVDGHLLIHSPPGGPTTITAGLPWRDRTKTPTNPLPEETP
ncbi:sensor domain-containing protein [Streptomyces sp. 549]|uniref:sensor histidine kinase n=1 Tax=Streptomyces sp. 549 TaxID=3049076 RepID=UPI0024C3D7AA|nr:sensor histidine kinase [Streptomyces sp. 549]MDK1472971.1 sensor domain-containing protein [Streptomyces sp. 549]